MMTNVNDAWAKVDEYFDSSLLGTDEVLTAAIAACDAAGLPQIQVAPNQGKLLMLLAQMVSASAILEVGTLGGYSAIWLARALAPDGQAIFCLGQQA
jgi:caffeoyl-CoA O-methyltransferase